MHSRASVTLAIAIATACSPAFSQSSRGASTESSRARGGPGALVFTDRNAFLAALPSTPEINPFDSVTPSESGWLLFERDGYGYGIYTQFGAHGALYNGAGFVSTERIADRIVVRFTGDRPVTAIGGNFWSSDFGLRPVHGSIVLKVADQGEGVEEVLESNGPDDFRGFITTSPILQLTIDAPDVASPPPGASPDRWAALDNLIVGTSE